jgi:4-amino-4-deoxy-L-arabinose transferase-like glycosyltransferase
MNRDVTRPIFIASVALMLSAGLFLRAVWLRSDPPTRAVVGVVWHDEGPWVHNARNRALWGVWRTDNWNPVYLTPVFTALEYGVFSVVGVGTWQARVVPIASGIAAIALLIAGLNASANRRTALLGGALLSINYVFVMWNRAALMESTMTSLLVASWAAYAIAGQRAGWGFLAGIAAVLAFFTKASAAFFVGAIVAEALIALALDRQSRAAIWMLVGLAAAASIIGVLFVVPHWAEFRFYNWQMSVVRKPDYSVRALLDRASWLPLVHDFFMWMWPVLVAAAIEICGVVMWWREAKPAERLLVLWVVVGLLELVVHDSGNERRYVMFIPAIIALGATWLARPRASRRTADSAAQFTRWPLSLLMAVLGYLVAGSALRGAFLEDVHAGHLHRVVLLSAALAGAIAVIGLLRWRVVARWVDGRRPSGLVVAAAIVVTIGTDLGHFAGWAHDRRDLNYRASVEVGRLLPPGTLVQGKLANGLALENRIRPVFIGHGFGNYDDRLQRDDVRYILTYVSPSVGYESQEGSGMIQEILNQYPGRRLVAVLPVDETGGPDRAGLIEKNPGSAPSARD